MNADLQVIPGGAQLGADDRARLASVARVVTAAARLLRRHGAAAIEQSDLEAIGLLAVWRKLSTFDPERATFERWAFYQAFRTMIDVLRVETKETRFEAALARGVEQHVRCDDRPTEIDLDNDTPETDLARLRAWTRSVLATAWIETATAREDEDRAETSIAAQQAVRALHEEIARLSEEQRAHLEARFWDDEDVRDVAARLGMSERTLRRRWVETRELLEARLRARGFLGIPEGFGRAADALAMRRKPR
ncbi:MAG: sigma-70 family RNA polymerase sigma factor [Polyangiaceae bacterium]